MPFAGRNTNRARAAATSKPFRLSSECTTSHNAVHENQLYFGQTSSSRVRKLRPPKRAAQKSSGAIILRVPKCRSHPLGRWPNQTICKPPQSLWSLLLPGGTREQERLGP